MEWISVKDRLPSKADCVLVAGVGNDRGGWSFVTIGIYQHKGWTDDMDEYMPNVTHWMPLPEPPPAKDSNA